jgi:hypothetical protein
MIVGVLGVVIPLFSNAQALSGEWKVDYGLTVNFYEENFRDLGVESALLKCSAQNSKLYFSEGYVKYELAAHMCKYRGREGRVDGSSNAFKYTLIGRGVDQSAISLQGDFESRIELINWLAEDVFWVDVSSESSLYRYYYRRVR